MQKEAALLRQAGEGVLKAIVDLCQQPGAKLGGQHVPTEFYRVADGKVRRVLKDLHVRLSAPNAYDFAHQSQFAQTGKSDFVLADRALKCDSQHVAVDADDFAAALVHGLNQPC